MKKCICTLLLLFLFLPTNVFSQTSENISLLCKTKFNRYYGVGDVWGVKINNVNYALVTLDGGLSIVNTNNQINPAEVAHINRIFYDPVNPIDTIRLWIPDIETFVYGATTYAYLATNKKNDDPPFPLVMIINLNEAISTGGEILVDPFNPSGSVYVGKIDDIVEIKQSHTLTIAGNYLYVATLNDSLPVWDLGSSPTSPEYLGFITVNPSDAAIHEMYVNSLSSQSARVYASCLTGGLQVLDLSYNPTEGGSTSITVDSRVEHLYDFDRAYPNQRESGDPFFDYRFTHSAWPTADEQYIFTTDEIALDFTAPLTQYSAGDPNLYSTGTLKSPRREGAFLRTWKRSLLGSDNSFKGGYYVPEGYNQGITDLTTIDTNWTPNSIHQMFGKGSALYVTHYTQGLRLLDISDPENLVELGYYDDFPTINFNPASDLFFRKDFNWAKGIYGLFPDQNRPDICYAGGSDGFYIFDVLPVAAPTGFTLSGSVGEHPTLSWDASSAVGLTGYKLYQKWGSGSYFLLINLGRNTTSFTDLGVTIGSGGKFAPVTCYRVTAYNIIDRESAPSGQKCAVVGAVQKSGDSSDDEEVSYEFNLLQAYPNPFNPSTQISYSLAGDADVTLIVYDMLGIEVANLVNETQSAGNYEINFDAENLASGVYIYRVVVSKNGQVSFTDTKQMILMK